MSVNDKKLFLTNRYFMNIILVIRPPAPLTEVPQGGYFFIQEVYAMDVKKPTTFEQQLDKLKSRGCIIEDEKKALTVLRRVNYYRLTAYFLPFTDNDGNYISCTSYYDRIQYVFTISNICVDNY